MIIVMKKIYYILELNGLMQTPFKVGYQVITLLVLMLFITFNLHGDSRVTAYIS